MKDENNNLDHLINRRIQMLKVTQKYYDNGKTEAEYKETCGDMDSVFEERDGYDLYVDYVGTEEEAIRLVEDTLNA